MITIDYQNNDYDFLLQLRAAQDRAGSSILDKALACDLFTVITEGKSLHDVMQLLQLDEIGTQLFLNVLAKMGLIIQNKGFIANAPVSAKYLTSVSPFCSLEALKNGEISDRFIAEKLIPMVTYFQGNILLDGFSPSMQAMLQKECAEVTFDDSLPYDLIITGGDYVSRTEMLKPDGVLGVMGVYMEEYSLQTAIGRLQNYLNPSTFSANSNVLSASELLEADAVAANFEKKQMVHTPRLRLTQDISIIFAAKTKDKLEEITITQEAQLYANLISLPVQSVTEINPKDIVTAHWTKDHCRYGCSSYGEKCCPPNSPSYEETRVKLDGYTRAFLIEGQPPTREFQKVMLNAEKLAFQQGFYKAFSFWAGPCHLCEECRPPASPKKCTATRPSMESAGIDVFATVKSVGKTMRTLKGKTEFVKYFGLLLLE